MDWKEVKSSNITHLGYDAEKKLLGVRFKSGGEYHYHDVPEEEHLALLAAESHGSHLHAKIRGRFKHSKADSG